MIDVNIKTHLSTVLGERSEGAALDLFSIVVVLFSCFGQEVEGDVMGGVHPDCLIASFTFFFFFLLFCVQ